MWTLLRALAYATCFVALLLIILPAGLLRVAGIESPHMFGAMQIAGVVVTMVGAGLAASCILTFVFIGKGTQAPFDPPQRLVIRGPYRLVRNPMFLGAGLVPAGGALYFGSVALGVYAAAVWLVTHLAVVLSEEPTLRLRFGSEYESYCSRTGRWFPRFPA